MTAFQQICQDVGMLVIGEIVAENAVLELLPCVGLNRRFAEKNPKRTAQLITDYLDDVAANP